MSSRPNLLASTILLTILIGFIGCGVPGAPQPPSLRLPKPVSDLTGTRKGDRVLLTWTPPTQTIDGENLRHAGTTEICRGVNEFPMIRCNEKVGTLGDAQIEHWTKGTMAGRREFTDDIPQSLPQQYPLGQATYALRDLNSNGQAAGLSNQVRVSLAPTLPPPESLKGDVTADGVNLTWAVTGTPVQNPKLRYLYRVFRQSLIDEKKPEMIVGEVPLNGEQSLAFLDRNIEWEQHYSYRVAPITQVELPGKESAEVEGDDTPPIEVFAHDIFPPATPTGVQAVFSGVGQKSFIDLTWAPNLESDLAGYNVYRHEQGNKPEKINFELVKTPTFRDVNVLPGHEYFYSVSAVDLRNNESGKSEETSEKVPEH
jgi:hypothetical protein